MHHLLRLAPPVVWRPINLGEVRWQRCRTCALAVQGRGMPGPVS